MPSPWWVHAGFALASLCGWLSLAVLALRPNGSWPGSGVRGNIERAALFGVVAAVTRATLTEQETRWQIAALAVAAALFETVRRRRAGGSNGGPGWMASTTGAIVGAVLVRHVAHVYFWRWGWDW